MNGFLASSAFTGRVSVPLLPACGACGLNRLHPQGKLKVVGGGRRKIMLVVEAPTHEANEEKNLSVGGEISFLRERLGRCGVDMKEDCWLISAARCCLPKGKMPPKTVDHCRPLTVNDINELKPEIVVLLGQAALAGGRGADRTMDGVSDTGSKDQRVAVSDVRSGDGSERTKNEQRW